MREANLYETLAGNKVRCNLCAHHCVIADGRKGVGQVRENRGGTLFTLVYGQTIAQHVEPIEKKPLFHYFPGSTAYSIATPGCNFRCRWCQNWNISQLPHEQHLISGHHATPQQIVTAAKNNGCRSIALQLTGLVDLPPILVVFLIAGLTLLIGAFISNTACAAMLIPLALPLAQILHMDPRLLVAIVAIASSIDFALVVGTPPTMMAYSTGFFEAKEIFKRGSTLDLIGILVLSFGIIWIWQLLGAATL